MLRTFKQRLAEDELIRVFAMGRVVHPVVIEMFGLAGGYAGFWLDGEHVGLTTDQMVMASLAARANDFDSFVRIPPIGYWHVTQCLETGMGGVMAAQIHSAEQAEEFVQWAKFAPRGKRGINGSGRDANYTHKSISQFTQEANREQFVAIQIETAGAVDDADKIASIEDVDLLFVGPTDLSSALGVGGEFHHQKLWEAIDHVATVCRKHGKAWGAVTPDAEFADRAVEKGCRMPTFGSEISALRKGIGAIEQNFEKLFS